MFLFCFSSFSLASHLIFIFSSALFSLFCPTFTSLKCSLCSTHNHLPILMPRKPEPVLKKTMTVQSQPYTRRRSTCHRHPTTPVTGFCASCLRERLAGIEAAAAASSNKSTSHPGSELRRSKSCSGGPKPDGFPANPCGGGCDESQRRKSCDVRPRGSNSSLWSLFNIDDERKGTPGKFEAELGKKLGFDLKEEEEEEIRAEADAKTMKELIDLEWAKKRSTGTGRDLREIAGTLWGKASGLMSIKKLTKWRRKTKEKKEDGTGVDVDEFENEGVPRRETQSEVGEYGPGGGRRSCDTDPRRFSFDEPRASWDGYLIGRETAAARMAPMVAVVEDGAERSSPGGSEQTMDYYSEPRTCRRSFDGGGGNGVEDSRAVLSSNAKVSPATTELFYGPKLLITERDLKVKPVAADGPLHHKKAASHGWGRLWRRTGGERKCDNMGGGGLLVGPTGTVSEKLIRSYSVSCRNQQQSLNPSKSREEFLLQRNRSARYSPSPSSADNGLLRFYLTPLRSYSRRGGGGQSGKTRLKSSNSIATIMPKNVL